MSKSAKVLKIFLGKCCGNCDHSTVGFRERDAEIGDWYLCEGCGTPWLIMQFTCPDCAVLHRGVVPMCGDALDAAIERIPPIGRKVLLEAIEAAQPRGAGKAPQSATGETVH